MYPLGEGVMEENNMRTILQRRMSSALTAGVLSVGAFTVVPAFALDQAVVTPKAMIVAGQPLAAEPGLKILRAGGAACQACVATAATLSLNQTDMMGPRASGFALVYTPSGEDQDARAIDYSGVAPAATDPAKFKSM